MAYIIEGTEYPVIYIANYRVGSTATAATLMDMGARQVNHHHGLPSLEDAYIPSALTVQTVRHHADVITSLWFKQGMRCEIEELIDNILAGENDYLRPHTFYDRYPCNFPLRYENLQFEFDNLCVIAGLPETTLKVKPSQRPAKHDWREVINNVQAERIYSHYQKEMDHYGYGPFGNLPKEDQEKLDEILRKSNLRNRGN